MRTLLKATHATEPPKLTQRLVAIPLFCILCSPDKIKGDATSFDIDLGDWFDQLAGTSTGGLLALYCEFAASVLCQHPSDNST